MTQVVQTPGALEIWQKGHDLNLKIAISHVLYVLYQITGSQTPESTVNLKVHSVVQSKGMSLSSGL